MRTLRRLLALLLLVLSASPSAAIATQRALVIGIDDYAEVPKLTRAVGDARAMSAVLVQIGFTVTTVLDPDRRQMNEAISAFRQSLQPEDVAFVHFSGHGVEVKGHDLLLPRDIPLPSIGQEDFLTEEAIDLNSLMDRVSDSGASVRIFIIDACRDNPFPMAQSRGLGQARGLAIVAPPRGSFVLYSAGYGQSALDGLGPDDKSETSVYTRVLLEKLKTPGLTISQIARDVRADVAALATTVGQQQFPAYYDELTDDYYLQPRAAPQKPSPDVETTAFAAAKDIGTTAAWDAFLTHYPDGVLADLARTALAGLAPASGATKPAATDRTTEASLAVGAPTPRYDVTPGLLLASFTVPVAGAIISWTLHFEYVTQCENDHRLLLISPSGLAVNLMERGLHRCSGTFTRFSGDNGDATGEFIGMDAAGTWQISFADLDANAYTGALTNARLDLGIEVDGEPTRYTIALKGLPKTVPNPK